MISCATAAVITDRPGPPTASQIEGMFSEIFKSPELVQCQAMEEFLGRESSNSGRENSSRDSGPLSTSHDDGDMAQDSLTMTPLSLLLKDVNVRSVRIPR